MTSPIATEAQRLLAVHGGLLTPLRPEATEGQADAVARLEAAKARLCGPGMSRAVSEAQAMVDAGQIGLFEAACLVDVLEGEYRA